MSRSATLAIIVVIILAASAVFILGNRADTGTSEDSPSESDPPVEPGPTGMLVDGLPDGYSADPQTCIISAPSETDWLVIDRLVLVVGKIARVPQLDFNQAILDRTRRYPGIGQRRKHLREERNNTKPHKSV